MLDRLRESRGRRQRCRSGRVGARPPGRSARVDAWAESPRPRPDATERVPSALHQNLYGPGLACGIDPTFVSMITVSWANRVFDGARVGA